MSAATWSSCNKGDGTKMSLSETCKTAHMAESTQSCCTSNKADRADQTILYLDAKVVNCFGMK